MHKVWDAVVSECGLHRNRIIVVEVIFRAFTWATDRITSAGMPPTLRANYLSRSITYEVRLVLGRSREQSRDLQVSGELGLHIAVLRAAHADVVCRALRHRASVLLKTLQLSILAQPTT
jgi:hypothetical protein